MATKRKRHQQHRPAHDDLGTLAQQLAIALQGASKALEHAMHEAAAARELLEAVEVEAALSDYRSGRDPGLTTDEMRELLAAPTPLAFWRRKRGLTQAELAEAAGIAQNYVSDLETGKREGSPSQWLAISRTLGISMEELLAKPEDPQPRRSSR